MKKLKGVIAGVTICILSLCLYGCSIVENMINNENAVKVGAKNFTEQYILGELIAQVIENENIKVERVFGMSGIKLVHNSISNGAIDIYPEYTGAALMYILKKDLNKDPQKVFDIVKREYRQKYNLIWLNQAPMENKSVLVTTKEIANKYSLNTLSDFISKEDNLIFCSTAEFWDRKDGIKELQRVYGGFNNFKDVIKMDLGMQYNALLKGQFDVALGNSTDGQIYQYNLVVLEDDKKALPPYNVGFVLRPEILKKHPNLKDKLNKLSSILTTEVMIELNYKVDGEDNMEPEDVAKEFLQKNKII